MVPDLKGPVPVRRTLKVFKPPFDAADLFLQLISESELLRNVFFSFINERTEDSCLGTPQ